MFAMICCENLMEKICYKIEFWMEKMNWFSINRAILFITLINTFLITLQNFLSDNEVFTTDFYLKPFNICSSNDTDLISLKKNVVNENIETFTYVMWTCSIFGILHALIECLYFKEDQIYFFHFLFGTNIILESSSQEISNLDVESRGSGDNMVVGTFYNNIKDV